MKNKHKRLLLCSVAAIIVMIIYASGLFNSIDYKLQDFLFQKPGNVSPDIVVFGIDEKTLSELGRFQTWSRNIMADAIRILNSGEYQPAVIAIDVLYTEEGHDPDADTNLAAAALEGGNVVMASYAQIGRSMTLRQTILSHELPYPELARSAAYGFVNSINDSDGVIRNMPIKFVLNDEEIFSFPYATYRLFTGDTSPLDYSADEAYITYYGNPGDYYGDSASGSGMSFSDIFAEDFDPDFFADCIVLIGAYATGFGDAYYTPINAGTQMYGVEIHANAIQMLIEGNFKERISFWNFFFILLLILIVSLVLTDLLEIRLLLLAFAAISVIYYLGVIWLYDLGFVIPLLYPALSLFLIYICRLVYGYVLERLEKRKLRSTFEKYVDPSLAGHLIDSGEANSEESGIKKHIAIMFVDIRGFTPMTEALRDSPEILVQILNEYLQLTSGAVFSNGGSVDKFVGDATMALFNGFAPLSDYVYLAVKAAWDIVRGATELNASIKEKYGIDLGFGIGVNCGEAIVGNIGTSFRKDYTAIGDAVNTAARLESNAGASEVLISREVFDTVKDRIEAVSVGEIPLKGKSIKIEVFSVKALL